MTITGLYLIPDTGISTASATSASPSLLTTLIDRLIKAHNPEHLGKWGLETRLMRETVTSAANLAATGGGGSLATAAAAGGAEATSGVRFLQFLTLTHHPNRSYVSISTVPSSGSTASTTTPTTPQQPPAPPATVISIPHPQGREEFLGVMLAKLAPLWALFQTLDVANGTGFAVKSGTDQLHVRLGELRGKHGLRGVVVEVSIVNADISATAAEEGDDAAPKDDWEKGEATIRTFWDSLGLKNGRAYIRVAGVGEGPASSRRLDLARQYCEMLKLRGP